MKPNIQAHTQEYFTGTFRLQTRDYAPKIVVNGWRRTKSIMTVLLFYVHGRKDLNQQSKERNKRNWVQWGIVKSNRKVDHHLPKF